MNKKIKTILVLLLVTIIIISALYFFIFKDNNQRDESSKFVGNWIITYGMGMPENATVYFKFYSNRSVERTMVYPTFIKNSYWMNYWFDNNLIYIAVKNTQNVPGFSYEFLNNDNNFKLLIDGNIEAIFNKVDYSASNLWIKTFDGSNKPDEACSVTTDLEGNVYVAGWTSNVSGDTSYDWWIKKFDEKGNEDIINWNKIIGFKEKNEQARSITTDSIGNVYVVGYGYNISSKSNDNKNTGEDWLIKKFDSNGKEDTINWNKAYDYNKTFDMATSVEVDDYNNVYVFGYLWQPYTNNDKNLKPPKMCIKKYDSNGNEDTINWNKTFDNGGFSGDIFIDNDENVYVVWTGSDQNWLVYGAIKKFDKNGNEIWSKIYYSNESKIFTPSSITVDTNGNVYVSGVRLYEFKNECWWIKKFDVEGIEDNINWNITYDSEGNLDQPKSISLDSKGYVYVAGFGTNLTGNNGKDWWIMKFDSNGNRIWEKMYDGSGYNDEVLATSVYKDGIVYIAGYGTHLKDYSYQDWWIKKLID